MVASMVVVFDEGFDGLLECTGQVVVFEQNPVLHGLVPALDLALGLGMVRRTANVIHALAIKPPGQVVGDVGRSVIAEQPRLVQNRRAVAA